MANHSPAKNSGNQPASLTQEQVDMIIANQRKTLENQALSASVAEKRIEANKELALKSIDAQKSDRAAERKDQAQRDTKVLVFVIILVGLFMFGLGWLLTNQHKDLATHVLTLVFGGAGGYGIGVSKKKSESAKGAISDANVIE